MWGGTTPERLDLIRTSSDTMIEIGESSPSVPVPRYQGWSITDLLAHTGKVHRRTTAIVSQSLAERPPAAEEPDSGVVDWFAAGVSEMIDVLRSADPSTPCWGFGESPTVQFWIRRMSLETAVHRWDAESAVGVAEPFDPAIAADGIDEVRTMWLGAVPVDPSGGYGPIVVFDPVDADGTWTLVADEERYRLVAGDMDAPCRVRGPASDIYLAILSRLHGRLEERGEIDALARWRTVVQSMGDARR